jgi:hemerythrin-like domain-containing protein
MRCQCIDILLDEHKTILRAVRVLCEIAKQTNNGQQLPTEDIRGVLEIFRRFADDFHQGKEESALFPVFTAGCDKSLIDPVRHMLFEHDQERSLIEGMEDALLRSNPTDFAEYAARMAEMMTNHIHKEDTLLFEVVDRALSAEDDQRVINGFGAFDRDFKSAGHDRLLHRLRMLEWKYLRKAA